MPANIVKSKSDEALWARAKIQAAKQDQGDNYSYITSIFKKMKEGSEGEKTAQRGSRFHGNVAVRRDDKGKVYGIVRYKGYKNVPGYGRAPITAPIKLDSPEGRMFIAKDKISSFMKKHGSAEKIFWSAAMDELEKCGARLGMGAGELIRKLSAAFKAGKATRTQINVLKNLRDVQRRGGDVKKYVEQFTSRLPNV